MTHVAPVRASPLADEANHRVQPLAGLEVGEHEGALAALGLGVVGHHLERGADQRREVDLVDDQQIRLGDAGAALAGIFSPAATSIT
jgi:hypothetical protein